MTDPNHTRLASHPYGYVCEGTCPEGEPGTADAGMVRHVGRPVVLSTWPEGEAAGWSTVERWDDPGAPAEEPMAYWRDQDGGVYQCRLVDAEAYHLAALAEIRAARQGHAADVAASTAPLPSSRR